jgi:3-methyladenine DNA glycosylase AlkD
MATRSGWNFTSSRVVKNPEGLDIPAILNRLDSEMGSAPEVTQWTINFTLVEIDIRLPEHRQQAIAIAERLGIYRDYPVSKGCRSPFAPIWIEAMVSRQSNTEK